jgi:hypothetical protein
MLSSIALIFEEEEAVTIEMNEPVSLTFATRFVFYSTASVQ